jgi:hypothetical protein
MQYRDEVTGNLIRDSRPEPELTPRQKAEATIRARNGGDIPDRWAEMLQETYPAEANTTPSSAALQFSDVGQGHRGTNTKSPIDVTRLKDHTYYLERKTDTLDAIKNNTL